jgi:23S rRNA pseudouridine1911/1915/1917 synthase
MEKRIFRVEKIEQNKRVDKYLVEKLKVYSREFIKVLCKNKFIKVNNRFVEPSYKVCDGDVLEVEIPQREDYIVGKIENIETVYEDEDLLVVNKPPFLKVHPAKKFDKDVTLIDLLYKKIPNVKDVLWPLQRPFLVHRLDKETSGVLIIAKTPQVQLGLAKQFQQRKIKKVYHAIVSNVPKVKTGEIIAPIKKQRNVSLIGPGGKEAKTLFKIISDTEKFAYLELHPITGRTHQIRTHLKFIGCPIIGDVKYGGVDKIEDKRIPRPMLHAYSIEFYHPRRKQWLKFSVEPPEDFKFFLSYLSLV